MPRFAVLHVCMGNICRSPMAERLFAARIREISGGTAVGFVRSSSAGTGGWHEGEPMNPPAARQVRARGGDDAGFAARRLRAAHIDDADLVLTATADQVEYVNSLRSDAAPRTFVLGEFGRLLPRADLSGLPAVGGTPDAVYARGLALVEAVDAARAGAHPLPDDDLDDPWGRGDAFFARVAAEVDGTVGELATVLLR
ncbi:MAG TPA: phosphotyrosine protein phosphatase [Micromonosporaceae bacterium]|nr:phosphotyrosine protein phosphatase [Micromonosporaceae bacterium]